MTAAPQIAVAISTFERLAGLTMLLDALDRQHLEPWPDAAVTVIVVDNSPAATARGLCLDRASRFAVAYAYEPRRGLSFARNAALRMALACGATHVAFIDDDEMPDPGWLPALHARLGEAAADAAIGVVHPLFAAPPPAWAVEGGFFAKALPETGGRLLDGYTSNAMVDLATVRAHALAFDPRCNLTGGEDTLFFRDLLRAGGTIVLAAQAVVHETIPAHRIGAGWLFRRWFRTGATEASLGRYDPDSLVGRLHNGSRGSLRIVVGLGRVAHALFGAGRQPERLVGAFYTLCRGAGLVTCVFGRRYREYGVRGYRGG